MEEPLLLLYPQIYGGYKFVVSRENVLIVE